MRIIILGSAILGSAVLMACAQPALAQQPLAEVLPAVAAAPAVWSWTGCFVGGHGGGVWSRESWVNRTPGGAHTNLSLGAHDVASVLGGVQGGCDVQVKDGPLSGLVVGIQGDVAWADGAGAHASTREFGVTYDSTVRGLASVTGRIGYAAGRVLGYMRGGAAWQRGDSGAATIITGPAYTASTTRAGWTVGAGVEYAVTAWLSGFVEYNYADFGTQRIGFTPRLAGLPPAFVDIKQSSNVVRVGVNVRFGG